MSIGGASYTVWDGETWRFGPDYGFITTRAYKILLQSVTTASNQIAVDLRPSDLGVSVSDFDRFEIEFENVGPNNGDVPLKVRVADSKGDNAWSPGHNVTFSQNISPGSGVLKLFKGPIPGFAHSTLRATTYNYTGVIHPASAVNIDRIQFFYSTNSQMIISGSTFRLYGVGRKA